MVITNQQLIVELTKHPKDAVIEIESYTDDTVSLKANGKTVIDTDVNREQILGENT